MNAIARRLIGPSAAYSLMKPLWDAASEQFAKSASNVVHVFINSSGINFESTFLTIEYWIVRELGVELVIHFVD